MDSEFIGPVNIGSEEMVTINELVETAARVSGKEVTKMHIDGPTGVRGRNSNNDVVRRELVGITLVSRRGYPQNIRMDFCTNR